MEKNEDIENNLGWKTAYEMQVKLVQLYADYNRCLREQLEMLIPLVRSEDAFGSGILSAIGDDKEEEEK